MRIIDNATAEVEVIFQEPSTNFDGTPLADLAYSSVYYKIGAGALIAGAKLTATKASGGGDMKTSLIVPAPSGVRTVVQFQVSSTDLTGNESPKTPAISFEIERMAPAVPSGFTVA